MCDEDATINKSVNCRAVEIIAWCMFSGGHAVGDAQRALCTAKSEVAVVQRGLGMSKVTMEGGR